MTDATPAIPPRLVQRSAARLGAVQLLFQQESETKPSSIPDALAAFSSQLLENMQDDDEEGLSYQADMAFLRQLIEGTLKEKQRIDDALLPHLSSEWRYERMDSVLRAILRVASWEMLFTQTPTNVVINEYIEIAKAFFSGSEPKFVNGFLDQMAKRERSVAL